MDSDTQQIVLVCLQIISILLTAISSYRNGRQMLTRKTRRERRQDIENTLNYLSQHTNENHEIQRNQSKLLNDIFEHLKINSTGSQ